MEKEKDELKIVRTGVGAFEIDGQLSPEQIAEIEKTGKTTLRWVKQDHTHNECDLTQEPHQTQDQEPQK